MNGPLFIFAPDRRGAAFEARERGLSPREWRYVSGWRDVYGYRDGQYVTRIYGPGLSEAQWDAWHYARAAGFRNVEDRS